MGTRRKGREAALQILYQIDMAGVSAEQAIRDYWLLLAPSREGEDFANLLVRGYCSEAESIDEVIRGVSQHWRFERMIRVDRNILRLSVYELKHVDDVPRRVTLNEAIELAKKYGTESSPGFVNGVLDRIANDLGKQ